METCNRHNWGIEKKELKHIWLPPNSNGQHLNSWRIDMHMKCGNCNTTMIDKFYREADIEILYETNKDK